MGAIGVLVGEARKLASTGTKSKKRIVLTHPWLVITLEQPLPPALRAFAIGAGIRNCFRHLRYCHWQIIKRKRKRQLGCALAIGYSAKSLGKQSIAIGASAIAQEESTIAIGCQATATDAKAIAIGQKAKQSLVAKALQLVLIRLRPQQTVFAIGFQSDASGSATIAIGCKANASGGSGGKAVAIGEQAKASGTNSYAIGVQAKATETNSFAIGTQAKATGQVRSDIGKPDEKLE